MKIIKSHPKAAFTNGVRLTLSELIAALSDVEIALNNSDSFFIDSDTQVAIFADGNRLAPNKVVVELWDNSDELVEIAQLTEVVA